MCSAGVGVRLSHSCLLGWPVSLVELQFCKALAGGGKLYLNNSMNTVKQQHELRAIFLKLE